MLKNIRFVLLQNLIRDFEDGRISVEEFRNAVLVVTENMVVEK